MADSTILGLTNLAQAGVVVTTDLVPVWDADAATTKKVLINNVPLSGNVELVALATGVVKNTTGTGALSIATAGTDYSAGTAALATGILKSTTGTGTLSIATAGSDYLAPIDPSPDADHGYSGTVISGTAGEALAINNLVYLKSDGKFWKAKGDATATLSAVGITTAAADAEAAVVILIWGYIRNDDGWGGALTKGSHGGGRIWVSEATAGLATQTAPASTNYAQLVGYGVADRTAFFHFCPTFYLVA